MDNISSPEIILKPDELLPVEKCRKFVDLLTSIVFATHPDTTSVSRAVLESCCTRFGVGLDDEIVIPASVDTVSVDLNAA